MPRKQPNSSFATVESLSNDIAGNRPERVAPPQREDDIGTMMGISPPTDSDPVSEGGTLNDPLSELRANEQFGLYTVYIVP